LARQFLSSNASFLIPHISALIHMPQWYAAVFDDPDFDQVDHQHTQAGLYPCLSCCVQGIFGSALKEQVRIMWTAKRHVSHPSAFSPVLLSPGFD
jgi:hypothetical protein